MTYLVCLVFRCGKCEWEWLLQCEMPMDARAFLALFAGASGICPGCGYKPLREARDGIMMVLDPAERAAAMAAIETRRAQPSLEARP